MAYDMQNASEKTLVGSLPDRVALDILIRKQILAEHLRSEK